MSLQLNNETSLPISRVFNTNVDIAREKAIKLFCGAKDVVYQNFPSNSKSNSQIVIPIQMPSKMTLLDRRIYIKVKWSVTLNGFGLFLNTNASNWGPRQYPLTSACNNVSVDVQNQRFSYDPSETTHAMSWFQNNEFFRRSFNSTACGMPDQAQNYIQNNGARNPFSSYTSNPLEETRTINNYCYRYDVTKAGITTSYDVTPDNNIQNPIPATVSSPPVIGDYPTKIVFYFETTEPVMVPPFLGGYEEEPALCGFTNALIVYNISNIRRMMSGLPYLQQAVIGVGSTPILSSLTSIDYNILDAVLLTRLYNMPLSYGFPKTCVWSIYQINRYIQQDPKLLNAGDSSSVTSQTIAWSGNPKLIFVYVKLSQASINQTKLYLATPSPNPVIQSFNIAQGEQFTDTYCTINNISITYDNKIVLATMTPQEMYQLAVRQGCVMTQSQYRAFVGGVLAVVPAFDFSLSDGDSSNVAGDHQFQITVNYTRPASQNYNLWYNPNVISGDTNKFTCELVVNAVQEGVMWVDMNEGVFKTMYNEVPKSVALTTPIEYGAFKHYNSLHLYVGSGFWDTLKGIVNSVATVASPILGALSAIPGPIGMVGKIGAPISAGIKAVTGGVNDYIRKRGNSRKR